jgi:redox-sensitive bicupin YhaK (pirin superfamily)
MSTRTIRQRVPASEVTEGAGVTVHRSIGTPALRNLDPFLMLDHFGSDNPDEYIAGFPDHPHRGFITFTYMLEMPRQANGLMRGFQLWINLPASEKMSDPAYQEFSAAAIPEVTRDGARVRVLAGEFNGTHGVIEDPSTDVLYLDVALAPNAAFSLPLDDARHTFIYVFEGSARLAGDDLARHTLAVLGSGDTVDVAAGAEGARFILVAGRPIGEPVVQYGPFVMSTRQEIEQAMADYRDGKLVRTRAAMSGR